MSTLTTDPAAPAVDLDLASRRAARRLRPLNLAMLLGGLALWVPVERLFMSELGFDATAVGLMAGVYAMVVPLLELPSGILADRWSRKFVHGALPPDRTTLIDEHLSACDGCRTVLEQWRTVVDLAGRVTADTLDALQPSTRDRLLASFRDQRTTELS